MVQRKAKAAVRGAEAPRRAIDLDLLPMLLGYNLRRAQVAVFGDFARAVGEPELTPGRFGVLTIIQANPGLNQTQLAEALGIDRSTVVSLIDRLESRGWVERAPSLTDRRSYALRLSPAGEALLAVLKRRVREHEARIARNLTPTEQRALIKLLRRISGDA